MYFLSSAQALPPVTSSLGEGDRLKLAVLENQLQQLQHRVGETAHSDTRLNHLLAQQQREREEWEETRRSLERQLTQERERTASSGEWEGSPRSVDRRGRLAAQMSGHGDEAELSRRSLERRLAEEKELREQLRKSSLDRGRLDSSGDNTALYRVRLYCRTGFARDVSH